MSYPDMPDDAGQDVDYERARDDWALRCEEHHRPRFDGEDSCRHLHPLVETRPEPVPVTYYLAAVVWLAALAVASGIAGFAFVGFVPDLVPWWASLIVSMLCVVGALSVAGLESYESATSEVDG